MKKNIDYRSHNIVIQSATNNLNHIFFLDYFRTFLVILVVLLHAAMAYIVNANNLWFFMDSQRNIIFDVYVFLFDKTVMPMFFFISGYFALSSILKSNIISFLKRKFVRLGIPLIIGIFIVNPFPIYISNLYNNRISTNFIDYWFNDYLKNIPFTLHLWFLGSLLIIMTLFSIIFAFKKRIFKTNHKTNLSTKFLLFFAIIIGLSLFTVNIFCEPLRANLLPRQPSIIPNRLTIITMLSKFNNTIFRSNNLNIIIT